MPAPTRRFIAVLAAGGALAAGLAACGSQDQSGSVGKTSTGAEPSSAKASAPSSVTVTSAKVGSLGTVLVSSQGRTLYIFVPDAHSKVSCDSSCQSVWPPEQAPASATAKASGAVKGSLLGSDPNPVGGRVVTYDGWPLYTYITDGGPGQSAGQGLNLNGGLWYVIRPNGQVEK